MITAMHLLNWGLLLCALMGIIVMGSLYANPRLWLQDYPAEIKTKVPPNTPQEKRLQWGLAVVFIGGMIAILYISTIQLKASGTLTFFTAWLNAFLLFNIGNLFDAVVLDLPLAILKPKFMILPNTQLADYAIFNDWRLHVGNYIKGVIIGAVFALPIALVALL